MYDYDTYDEGVNDYYCGFDLSENPYIYNSWAYYKWRKGWIDAECDDEY